MINHKYDEIITDRLIIRKANFDDLDSIYNNIWSDEVIASNMLWKVTKTREDAITRMERTINYQSNNYAYFICLKDTNEAIGFSGIKKIDKDIYEDAGLCIATKYQGMGFAKEVISAFIDLIFNELNGKRFIYGCFNTNEKSRNVCLKLGFNYLDSKELTREHDNKDFMVDYYYFDKDMYNKNT